MSRIGNGHWVNAYQTKQERQEKYWLARSAGLTASVAARMRDWTLSHVEKALGLGKKPRLELRPDGTIKDNSVPAV